MIESVSFASTWEKHQRLILLLAVVGAMALVSFNLSGMAAAPAAGLPSEFVFPGNDLVVYLKGGEALLEGTSPYATGAWPSAAVFHYSPAAALLIAQVSQAVTALTGELPFRTLAYAHLVLIIGAHALAWIVWRAVFKEVFSASATVMTALIPLWIVYSQWFADQNYLNIYTFLLVLVGASLLAVLHGQTLLAIVLTVLIMQSKPHYAFPVIFPLLAGNWRFFVKLVLGSTVGYVMVAGATLLIVGATYGLSLYGDYIAFLSGIAQNYPWVSFYLGYNHSWFSIIHWGFGIQPWVPLLITAIRLATLLPLLWLGWRWLQRLPDHAADRSTGALGLTFGLHLWAVSQLDQLWEASMLIVVLAYLLMAGTQAVRRLAVIVGVPFALLGLAQLAAWWIAPLLNRSADQLDVTARLPLIMAAVLGMYTLVLWTVRRTLSHTSPIAANV